jgi:hypothetical protein
MRRTCAAQFGECWHRFGVELVAVATEVDVIVFCTR